MNKMVWLAILVVVFLLILLIKNNDITSNVIFEEEKLIRVLLETTMGNIIIELRQDRPETAGNFEELAAKGFYDGVKFHRVIDGFMIQSGDPLTKDLANKGLWGTGDPGYKIKDEFSGGNRNDRGTISMANSGPNTGGSQFFINTANNNFLDTKHSVFGKVVEGMDVVDKISKVNKDLADRPVQDVIIKKAVVVES